MKRLFLFAVFCCSLGLCAAVEQGVACFTFDDYHGENWLKADAIFKKYDAHATFFIVRKLTPEKIGVMKKLQAAGHSIGLHTEHHRNATNFMESKGEKWYLDNEILPQLKICKENGLTVRNFAYPNNRRNEKTDAMLYKYFDYLRAGNGPAKKPIYYPVTEIKKQMVLGGGGIGVFYKSDVKELKSRLDHAAKTNTLIVFFSHNIAPDAKHIHMPTEMLEALLAHAQKLGMKVVGFDQLKSFCKDK